MRFAVLLLQATKVTLNYGIIRCPYLYFPKLVSFFFDPLSKLRLGTFRHAQKKMTVSKEGRAAILRTDRNLFARLLITGQSRQMDLEQSLVHELGTLPWSLELFDGALVKTNKAALPKLLEDGVESLKCLPAQTAAVIRRYSGASNAEQDNREILTTGRNDLQENTDARGSKNS